MREGGATTVRDVPQITNRCQMLYKQIKRTKGESRYFGACTFGRKDDRHEEYVIHGGARGEVVEEGQSFVSYMLSVVEPSKLAGYSTLFSLLF